MTESNRRTLTPAEAVQLHIDEKRSDGAAERTLETYVSELRTFTEWCGSEGIEHVHEIDGLDMKRFKSDQATEYARSTVGNRLRTAKALLSWCVSVNAADGDVVEQIEVKRANDVRTAEVTPQEAEAIRSHLERYKWASREHVTFLLLWTVGCRLGAIRALDVADIGSDFESVEGPSLRLRHRPETDTPLKNGADGERFVSISDDVRDVLSEYVEVTRPAVVDEYGRKPLLATKQGRAALATLRATLYAVTRPCWYGRDCPSGKDPETCNAAQSLRDARLCPENNSPHDVRRGRLTEYRREGIDKTAISDRSDVSAKILEEHYNQMSDGEKMEQRRNQFDGI